VTYPNYPFGFPPTDPTIVCWRDLDAADAESELERLDGWVIWITERYGLDHKVIPPCWGHHGAIVEELSALRTSGNPALPGRRRPVRTTRLPP
jgi:hypothetical protein